MRAAHPALRKATSRSEAGSEGKERLKRFGAQSIKKEREAMACIRLKIAGLAVVALLAAPVISRAADQDVTRPEVHQFDAFLNPHPELGSQLTHNPALAKDPAFLKKNPELERFLGSHPQIRQELNENPSGFMNNVDAYRQEVKNFDEFLKTHAAVHNDLTRNPRLADDAGYLAKHPELKQFIETHAGVRAELQSDPVNFMSREKGYERWMSDRSHAHTSARAKDKDKDRD
jgi:phage-related protein